jgi:hypothetical protein
MDKDFVPYDIALELKQLGFNESCFALFINGKFHFIFSEHQLDTIVLAPTFSQAFRWFRENHKLDGFVQIEPLNEKYGYVTYDRKKGNYTESKRKYTLEEAELACLIKLIEIVKGGNK